MNESPRSDQRHRERMERKKAVVDEKIAQARDERGVLLVHSGNGKGKSSSAFGMVARALGQWHEGRCRAVHQGRRQHRRGSLLPALPEEVSYHVMGEGFTWETQDRQRDIAKAEAAWKVAAQLLADPDVGLVVLDELNIALKHGYLELDRVLADIQARPAMQHVVVTGRGAQPGMIEAADTVTEMSLVKHAFKAGIKAQKGVEF